MKKYSKRDKLVSKPSCITPKEASLSNESYSSSKNNYRFFFKVLGKRIETNLCEGFFLFSMPKCTLIAARFWFLLKSCSNKLTSLIKKQISHKQNKKVTKKNPTHKGKVWSQKKKIHNRVVNRKPKIWISNVEKDFEKKYDFENSQFFSNNLRHFKILKKLFLAANC